MSRAIHEAISSWLFQDLSIVKKKCGDFGVLCITRLLDLFARVLIPEDGKQIRVQFCYETLLWHLLTIKHSHHFNFCLEFHDSFLLCCDGFTLINFKLSCCDYFIFLFSSCYIWRFTHIFFPFWPIYLFQTSISPTISLSVAWLCKLLLKVFQCI